MMRGLVFVLATTYVSATIFFQEDFGEGWEDRWVQSKHDSNYGKVIASAGKYFGDKARDTGLKTSQDARFYAIAAPFPSFSNKDKELVIQYTVKHEQNIDCGGGYLKLGPSTVDLKDFHGDSKYNIMFGPDICGGTKRTHFIVNYKGTNHLRRSDIRTESDEFSHLYTLILKPDQTYEVLIDQKTAASGDLLADFDFLPPKEIPDPSISKPEDWVDEATIADPEDTKPADWDDIPEFISDPDAKKPEDWDDEEDGEWEPPTIANPDFKGEWQPRQIDNPAYKGEWVHPKISNPDYHYDDSIYAFGDFAFVGIDIWQVKAGSIFDNIIITDDLAAAKAHAADTWAKLKDVEKKKAEEDKKKAEAAAAAADKDDDDDLEDHHHHHDHDHHDHDHHDHHGHDHHHDHGHDHSEL